MKRIEKKLEDVTYTTYYKGQESIPVEHYYLDFENKIQANYEAEIIENASYRSCFITFDKGGDFCINHWRDEENNYVRLTAFNEESECNCIDIYEPKEVPYSFEELATAISYDPSEFQYEIFELQDETKFQSLSDFANKHLNNTIKAVCSEIDSNRKIFDDKIAEQTKELKIIAMKELTKERLKEIEELQDNYRDR